MGENKTTKASVLRAFWEKIRPEASALFRRRDDIAKTKLEVHVRRRECMKRNIIG